MNVIIIWKWKQSILLTDTANTVMSRITIIPWLSKGKPFVLNLFLVLLTHHRTGSFINYYSDALHFLDESLVCKTVHAPHAPHAHYACMMHDLNAVTFFHEWSKVKSSYIMQRSYPSTWSEMKTSAFMDLASLPRGKMMGFPYKISFFLL